MTNAEARCNKSLRPRKPEGSLGRTAQDVHLDSHTAPELCVIRDTTASVVYRVSGVTSYHPKRRRTPFGQQAARATVLRKQGHKLYPAHHGSAPLMDQPHSPHSPWDSFFSLNNKNGRGWERRGGGSYTQIVLTPSLSQPVQFPG